MKITLIEIDRAVREAFCFQFNLKVAKDNLTINSFGDSLDTVEIALLVEETLDIDNELEDKFVETMGDLTVKQLIEKLQNILT